MKIRLTSLGLASIASAAIGLLATGCGGERVAASAAKPASAGMTGAGGHSTTAEATVSPGYLNDGDAEKADDRDRDNEVPNHEDTDADSSEEYEDAYGNDQYRDGDDAPVLAYGHAAGRASSHAVATAVERYFAVASKGDDSTACRLLAPSLANGVARSYGEAPGPAYLRGARTCEAVLSLLFAHSPHKFADPVKVTAVRLEGSQARAMLGSITMPASVIAVQREGGKWMLDGLVGGPLP
jgi:hypothetical protein